MTRLRQVLKELNISLDRAQDFIYEKTGEELGDANSKITQKAINLLTEEFRVDKRKKNKSKEIRKEIQEQEKVKKEAIIKDVKNARNGFKTTTYKLNYFFEKFNLIKSRSNDEWLEDLKKILIDSFEEMTVIHKSNKLPKGYKSELTPYLDELFDKYPTIKQSFHVNRRIKNLNQSSNRRSDIENENFSRGGLKGEEAYIGYWNID